MEQVTHPIAPVFDENSRILILGSFPSVKSREAAFFYGHPQNRFWKVVSGVLGCDCPQTIEEKCTMLLAHHIALWDVIASCRIEGSSDSSIRDAVPTDLSVLLAHAPFGLSSATARRPSGSTGAIRSRRPAFRRRFFLRPAPQTRLTVFRGY